MRQVSQAIIRTTMPANLRALRKLSENAPQRRRVRRGFSLKPFSELGVLCVSAVNCSGSLVPALPRWVTAISLMVLGLCARAGAVTLPELTSQVAGMNRSEREALLVKGARQEKEVMFYATTPVNQ